MTQYAVRRQCASSCVHARPVIVCPFPHGRGNMRAVDCFCGGGCASCGLASAGFEVCLGVDWDTEFLSVCFTYGPFQSDARCRRSVETLRSVGHVDAIRAPLQFSTCALCGPVTAVSVSYTQICSGQVFCRVHACFAHRILCASGAGYDIRMGKNKIYT